MASRKTPASAAKTAPAPEPAGPRQFTFEVVEGLEIPADLGRTPRTVELPFKARFEGMKHNASFFVPDAYWIEARGVSPEKATSGYIRNKIRSTFNDWRSKDDSRANRSLVLVSRQAGDLDGHFTEPGFSVFMQITGA